MVLFCKQKNTAMKISLLLCIGSLIGFIYYSYKHRRVLFEKNNLSGFLAGYSGLLAIFIGTMTYCLLTSPKFHFYAQDAMTFGIASTAATLLVLSIPSFHPEYSLIGSLWFYYLDYKKIFLGVMLVVASVPFITIFALKSHWYYGVIWYYGLSFVTLGWIMLEYVIEEIVEQTRTDERSGY